MREIEPGSTDVTINVLVQDSSSCTGAGLTGLVYNSAGIACYYVRSRAAAVHLILATQTPTGAHSDGGFVEIDATYAPGLYRLDLPDAVVAAGVDSVSLLLYGATNMAPVPVEINLKPVPSNVVQINGLDTDGYNATLKLRSIDVQNSTGAGIYARSAGGNAAGIDAVGSGTGAGILCTGGASGDGVKAGGGATSGHGVYAIASANGNGFRADGAGGGNGIFGLGDGTGHGISGNGGAGGGAGIYGQSLGTNGDGMELVKHGTGQDLNADETDATGIRSAVGLAAANLDTQIADIPTVAEFNARTLAAASYFDPATDTVANVSTVATLTGHTAQTADHTANLATLLSRLDATRAGKLDSLLTSGTVASQADISGITQAQRVRLIVPASLERPDSGSTTYRLWIYAYDELHQAEDLDGNPTVTAENNTGTDRSANLGTVTKPGATTGQYYVDYTVASGHAIEGLVFKADATEGAVTTQYATSTLVVDTTAIDFTAADRTKLEAVYNDWADGGRLDLILDDVPTVAEFNARTLAAASYFDPTTDTVANVTTVATTTTNTDKITAGEIRAAVGLASANLDTQLADIPTVSEFNARTLAAASYFDPTADTVANVTSVATLTGHTPQTADHTASIASILMDTGTTIETHLTDIKGTAFVKDTHSLTDILADTDELQLDDTPGAIAALNDISTADVNAQVLDVMNVDTFGEPGQGAPGATISIFAKINYLYKAWRNLHTETATTYSLYNDAGTVVDQKATVSDDATTFTRQEIVTGP